MCFFVELVFSLGNLSSGTIYRTVYITSTGGNKKLSSRFYMFCSEVLRFYKVLEPMSMNRLKVSIRI
jgi:hypothetical protein